MLVGLISYIMEIGGAALFLAIIYNVFLSDFIEEKMFNMRERKVKLQNAAKLAQVKLVSDVSKDIESFIANNAEYLSDEMVLRLVNRLEALKDDRIINDDILASKINNLEKKVKVKTNG
jgi:hypothetical protein